MQTFLPYQSFDETACCLDRLRLGKQRVEAFTILRILVGEIDGGNYSGHPAVLMWRGWGDALVAYYNTMLSEWERRGYRNIKLCMRSKEGESRSDSMMPCGHEKPKWLGDEAFHASHRSNLLMKDADWYGQFGWKEVPGLPYVWPAGKY